MNNSVIVMVNREEIEVIPTVERMAAYLVVLVALSKTVRKTMACCSTMENNSRAYNVACMNGFQFF